MNVYWRYSEKGIDYKDSEKILLDFGFRSCEHGKGFRYDYFNPGKKKPYNIHAVHSDGYYAIHRDVGNPHHIKGGPYTEGVIKNIRDELNKKVFWYRIKKLLRIV